MFKSVNLIKASVSDASALHAMQVDAFSALYAKFQDHDTSPAAESVDKVQARLREPQTDYYFIRLGDQTVGAVRVQCREAEGLCRVSPIFVLQAYRGKGVATSVFALLEKRYTSANGWLLRTIFEEEANCRLYERLGYRRVGEPKRINPRMHLVEYLKPIEPDSPCDTSL